MKNILKPFSAFTVAAVSSPIASLVGLPAAEGITSLLTTGVTNTVASILTTIGTDSLKNLKALPRVENYELQSGILHALENSFKQLTDQLDENERFIYKDLIDETIKVFSETSVNPQLMDEMFREDKEFSSLNDYYFTINGRGHQSVWEGIKNLLYNLQISNELSWSTNDESIQRLLAKMQYLMPNLFEKNIRDTLKSEGFDKTWKTFQYEILQEMFGLLNHLSSTSDEIKQKFESIKLEMENVLNELGRQLNRIEEGQLHIINQNDRIYSKVDEMLKHMKLNTPSMEFNDRFEDLPTSLIKISTDFLTKLNMVNNEKRQLYYKGASLTWDLVYYGYTAERKLTQELLNELQTPGFQIINVLGAGGEGKTTILMQAAVSLAKKGASVYYVDGMGGKVPNLDFIEEDSKQDSEQIYLFIDNSVHYSNMQQIIINSMKSSLTIKVIMANRQNMWNTSSLKKNVIDKMITSGSRQFTSLKVNKLVGDEALQIAKLLVDSNTVQTDDFQEIAKSLLIDTNGFLLAAMLTTTYGKSLEAIIHSILKQIQSFENGERILEILATIAVFDVVAYKNSPKSILCKKDLLVEIFDGDKEVLKLLSKHLSGEILNSPKFATTRHERIAQLFMNLLFDLEGDFVIDSNDILERILNAAIQRTKTKSKIPEIRLLYQIPRYFSKLEQYGYEFVRDLYNYITDENPLLFKVWVEWAKLEIQHKNCGEFWLEKSARWLFNQATLFSPNEALPWNSWIAFEKELGNVGSQEKMYTARWLAKESSLRNSTYQELWLSWADLEELSENYGSIDVPYSARWIYKEISNKNTKAPIWHKWAQLEYRLGNYGDFHVEYSFYWIVKQAQVSKNYTVINLWVEAEINRGNIGSIEKENSARYILHQNYMIHHEVAILAAKVEYLQKNVGSIDEEFSGRWYLNYAKVHFGLKSVATSWAKLEYELGEVGDVHLPYSARWIIWNALEEYPNQFSLWKLLIEIELKKGNIGDQNTPFTALWFYEKATTNVNLHISEVEQLQEMCEKYLTTKVN